MRVLAVVHEPDAGPGVFAQSIEEAGGELEQWLIAAGEPSPVDPLAVDALITLGGAMHPDQEADHPWIGEEKRLLAELIDRGMPLLGVCLGAELLASAAGGEVARAPQPEVGWYRVQTTHAGGDDPLLAPLAPEFEALEWHSYSFGLPPGGTALARSEAGLQAFRVGARAWGIQFHAEATLRDFESWLDHYRDDDDAVGMGLDPDALRAQTRASIGEWNALGRELCAQFLDVARRLC